MPLCEHACRRFREAWDFLPSRNSQAREGGVHLSAHLWVLSWDLKYLRGCGRHCHVGGHTHTHSALNNHAVSPREEEGQRYREGDREARTCEFRNGGDIFPPGLCRGGYVGFGRETVEQEHSIVDIMLRKSGA